MEIRSGDNLIIWRVLRTKERHIGAVSICEYGASDCALKSKNVFFRHRRNEEIVYDEAAEIERLKLNFTDRLRFKQIDLELYVNGEAYTEYVQWAYFLISDNNFNCTENTFFEFHIKNKTLYSDDSDCIILSRLIKNFETEESSQTEFFVLNDDTQKWNILYYIDEDMHNNYRLYDFFGCVLYKFKCKNYRRVFESAYQVINTFDGFKNKHRGIYYQAFELFHRDTDIIFFEKRFYYRKYLEKELNRLGAKLAVFEENNRTPGVLYYNYAYKDGTETCLIVKHYDTYFSIYEKL